MGLAEMLMAGLAGGVRGLNTGMDTVHQRQQQERERKRQEATGLLQLAQATKNLQMLGQAAGDLYGADVGQQASGAYGSLLDQEEGERQLKGLTGIMQQAIQAGDKGAAFGLAPSLVKARNAALGRNDAGPGFIKSYPTIQGAGSGNGDPGGAYVPVSYNDQGQAIEPAKVIDQGNAANMSALYGLAGVTPPAPPKPDYDRYKTVPGVGLVDLSTQQVVVKADDPLLEHKIALIKAQTVRAARPPAPRSGGRPPRARTQVVAEERDGKVVNVLYDLDTGRPVRELGVKPTRAARPTDPVIAEKRIVDAVKAKFPATFEEKTTGFPNPSLEQQRRAYEAQLRASAGGGDDEFDAWVKSKLKKGGK